MEEWKIIEGFENYSVSNKGNVKNNKRNKKLKPQIDDQGYKRVKLYLNGKPYCKQIHRLVALAFIPNPENKPCVDHILPIMNGGTNEVENLRWVTWKENSNNELSIKNGSDAKLGEKNPMYGKFGELNGMWQRYGELNGKSKKVINTDTFVVYGSARDAGRKTEIGYRSILSCCNGEYKKAFDKNKNETHWMFFDDFSSLFYVTFMIEKIGVL